MTCNLGTTDRIVRFLLGIVILGAGVMFQSWWGALSAIPLLTAVVKFCPVYPLIGVNTCRTA